jgi:hypothetical protein
MTTTATRKQEISLDLSHDLLALYTPPLTGSNASHLGHTRSVLLCFERESPNQTPIIVDGLLFALVISIPEGVDFDLFLKYMILTYSRRTYSNRSKDSVEKKHETLYDMEKNLMDEETKAFIWRQDSKNINDFIYCHKADIFFTKKDDDYEDGRRPRWQWWPVNSREIYDDRYATMRNINFIRSASSIEVKRHAKDERQYRIMFDNHVILYFFLQLFRFDVYLDWKKKDEEGDDVAPIHVTLLEPLDPAHEVFHGDDYVRYVEKQLDRREAHDFALHLSFETSVVLDGGLLQPAYYDREDAYLSFVNSPEEMYARRIVDDINRRKNKRDSNVISFALEYNRLFVNLRGWRVAHVDYRSRTKLIMSRDVCTSITTTTPKKEPSPRKAADKKLPKNQPTLGTLVNTYKENNPDAIMLIEPKEVITKPAMAKPIVTIKPKRKAEATILTLFNAQKRQKTREPGDIF